MGKEWTESEMMASINHVWKVAGHAASFEKAYGTEQELLELTNGLIA